MNTIDILSRSLSLKISSGEVANNPASVIKELVENSIDARSSKIVVDIHDDGTSFIQVSDNGVGMNKEDTVLSIEHHSTSKIKSQKDLFSIKTLGFRGEALPSIAAVSKLSIISKKRGNIFGTRMDLTAGKIKKVSISGGPTGTVVTVKKLFFNTPARKKFIQYGKNYLKPIIKMIDSFAIGNQHIRFKLIHNKKIINDWIKFKNPDNRIITIFNKNFNNFIKINKIKKPYEIKGWISNPQLSQSNKEKIYLYINGRWVLRDKILYKGIISGYKRRLPNGRYPIAIIHITLPFDHVDVNVHPAKHEVHFYNQNNIKLFVSESINESLIDFDESKWNHHIYNNFLISKEKKNKHKNNDLSKNNILKYNLNKKIITQNKIWKKSFFLDLNLIGIYHDTYLIFESLEDMILIDQHAAHERIIFEELKKNAESNSICSQKMIVTELLKTNIYEKEILKKIIPYLKKIGFDIEYFGYNTFKIKSFPTLISNKEIHELIQDLVDNQENIKNNINIETIILKSISKIACRKALKAFNHINKIEIKNMMKKLDSCKNSSYCPHGRPIWIKFNHSYIEKKFGRRR